MNCRSNYYTEEEIERMRKDAEKRAREMNERNRNIVKRTPEERDGGNAEKDETRQKEVTGEKSIKSTAIEEGKIIIILLLLLLMNEKGDPKLILALMWILI